jgi:hypothetical protein
LKKITNQFQCPQSVSTQDPRTSNTHQSPSNENSRNIAGEIAIRQSENPSLLETIYELPTLLKELSLTINDKVKVWRRLEYPEDEREHKEGYILPKTKNGVQVNASLFVSTFPAIPT